MCGSRQWASDVWSLSLAAFSFPSPADAPDDWPVGLGRLPPARAPAAACSGIGSIAEVSEVEVLVVGPAVTGPLEVGPAETGPALSANCGSDGRRARVRARGKRAEGRVCSVTVAAVRLKEVWLRGPEGNRRPEPPPGVHLQAVGVKTVMYWSLNKISVYGDRVHGEAVPVSSQLISSTIKQTKRRVQKWQSRTRGRCHLAWPRRSTAPRAYYRLHPYRLATTAEGGGEEETHGD
eukprot:COSAG03_NODE_1695_length_3637_cov_1.821085_1_plen_234_part_10